MALLHIPNSIHPQDQRCDINVAVAVQEVIQSGATTKVGHNYLADVPVWLGLGAQGIMLHFCYSQLRNS